MASTLVNVNDNERCAHRSRLSNLLPRHPDSAIAHLEMDTFDMLMPATYTKDDALSLVV